MFLDIVSGGYIVTDYCLEPRNPDIKCINAPIRRAMINDLSLIESSIEKPNWVFYDREKSVIIVSVCVSDTGDLVI